MVESSPAKLLLNLGDPIQRCTGAILAEGDRQ
jgi:hypothetical protein